MREYRDKVQHIHVINGAGGDGGVEAYAMLVDGTYVGVQAKWFLNPIESDEIQKIRNSITTAKQVRPEIARYIVCIPRNLANKTGKSKKPERDRWNDFLKEIQKNYPGLELILWDESWLQTELQSPGAEGIVKFWFENQDMALEDLVHRFNLARDAWLNKRYLPSLHGTGKIHTSVLHLLGHPAARDRVMRQLLEADGVLAYTVFQIETYLDRYAERLCIWDDKELTTFLDILTRLPERLEIVGCYTQMLLHCSRHGTPPLPLDVAATFDDLVTPALVMLKESRKLPGGPQSRSDLEEALQSLQTANILPTLSKAHALLKPRNILIFGDPGTGKTHGLGYEVEKRLDEGCPAVLIQAKSAPVSSGWGAMIRQTLGLSGNWAEDEIWSALEACAARSDRARALSTRQDGFILNELTRVLICVDGLDEASDRNSWLERIGELKPIIEKHQRLRFCLSSRPYFWDKAEDVGIPTIMLPRDGDTPVNTLFDDYISHYEIDCSQVPWVRWALTTPLTLRLFCEQYRGKSFHRNDEVRTTVAALLRVKIDRIDAELRERLDNRWGSSDQVVLRSLNAIARSERALTRNVAGDLIRTAQAPDSLLDTPICLKILDSFVDYGVINEYVPPTTDPLRPSERYYQLSMAPLADYLIAVGAVDETVRTGSCTLPQVLRTKPAAQEMAALILMSDHELFVGDNGLWTEDLPATKIEELRLRTLARAPVWKTARYQPWVKSRLKESMPSCRKVLAYLAIPVSRMEGHPLGPRLVHETLLDFPSVAPRDPIFSGPEYIPHNHGAPWEGYGENPVAHETLVRTDTHEGLPLLFAWSLTTVDESLRYHCRRELTTWGKENPGEFLKLLELTYPTDDPQVKEELVIVTAGVACLLEPEEGAPLAALAHWALTEIFDDGKIQKVQNIVIRHMGRIIIERASYRGLLEEADVKRARPPYPKTDVLLELDREAASATGETFGPIFMDLGWYVLKTGYEGLLGGYGDRLPQSVDNLSPDARELLRRHAAATGVPDLSPHQFALGASIAYLKSLGWNEEEFYGEPRGGEEGERLGADVAVSRVHPRSRYYARSPVATFAEKYVWCSVHEIRGYLADRLPYRDREDKIFRQVEDYGCIYNMPPSTAQEVREKNKREAWFYPIDLFPEHSPLNGERQQAIRTWIDTTPVLPFEPWIFPSAESLRGICDENSDPWVCLYCMTSATELRLDVRSVLTINAFLTAESDFEAFLSDCKKPGETDATSFVRSSYNITTSIRASASHFTPVDVLWMDWLSEREDIRALSTGHDRSVSYHIYPATLQGIYESAGSKEIYYRLPSKKVRNLLAIAGGDERRYFTKSGRLQGFGSKVGEPWRNPQELVFVRSEDLHKALNSQNLKIFWTVNLLREPSPCAREEFPDLYHIQDRYWVFWEGKGGLQSVEILLE
jgi:hypothetical protein